jgi:hypothetical protein
VGVEVKTCLVRSAVCENVAHPDGARRRLAIEPVNGDESSNSAHD